MQGLSELIDATMQQWKVPGLAIAVVKDNEIIFCEGFGLRDVKNNLNVTSKTLFAIGSCTKAFTTMAMGILVERGLLDWDKPVINYLPSFKLYDSYATQHITPRDLVTHRSGLPRHDAIWYNTSFTRQQVFNRLQYLEPTEELRTVFQYNNLMYLAAGYLVGEIAGCTWEEFVQQEIFNPLQMTGSNFSVVTCQQADDFALPYAKKSESVKEIRFLNLDTIGPAGSINSCVTDMASWLLLHLNGGKVGEKKIISTNNLMQMHTPQIVIQQPLEYQELFHISYGMGWGITAYRGHHLIQHSGGIDGFSALTTLLPGDNIGIVVLTNLNETLLPSIVTYNVCDRLLELDEVAWSDRLGEKEAQFEEIQAKKQEEIVGDRKPDTQPSHPLEDYTGDFEHPGYGLISVELKDGNLITTFNSIKSHLTHYHYDTFESKSELSDLFDIPTELVSFQTDKKGNITSLSLPLEQTLKDIVFTRIPDKRMTETSFLSQFVGEYEITGLPNMKVSLKGNQLFMSVANQPDYELVAYKDTEFNLKILPGFSVKFNLDESGVTSAVLSQPNGVFTVNKKM